MELKKSSGLVSQYVRPSVRQSAPPFPVQCRHLSLFGCRHLALYIKSKIPSSSPSCKTPLLLSVFMNLSCYMELETFPVVLRDL